MNVSKAKLYMDAKHSEDFLLHARDFFRKSSPDVTIVKNGVVLPAHDNPSKLWADGGVLDEDGSFLESTYITHGFSFGGKYDFDSKNLVESDETVVYFNPLIKHWGHFICDLIPRLWYVKDSPKKYKIAYCGWNWHQDTGDFSGNFLELLNLIGISKDQLINIQKPTKFKKIIVPDPAFVQNEYYTQEFIDLIDVIVRAALKDAPKVPEKIYFSRAKLNLDKERGEAKIEKIFRGNGYTILYPETLSVKEQICYFNQAKEIAMIAGSISHNLMFTRSSNVHATIINKMDLPNGYQFSIDSLTKANLTYVDAFFAPRPVLYGMGPFLLTITKYLKQFLRDHNYRITATSLIPPRDLFWYYKKYHEIYQDPANQASLNDQMTALASEQKALKS